MFKKISTKQIFLLLTLVGLVAGIYYFWYKQPSSRIIQVSSIAQVDRFLNAEVLSDPSIANNTLVLFDLDNTLVEPTTELASEHWFDACLKLYQTKGLSCCQAIKIVLPIYMKILHEVQMKTVEPDTVSVFNNLLSKVPTIAVTSRSLPLCDLTFRQLQSVGINFQQSMLVKHAFALDTCPIRFDHGILFCSGTDKGCAVTQFLKKLHLSPQLIILVDDKLKHVQAVAKAAAQQNISFVGLRYGFLDEKVKSFTLDQKSIALLEQNAPGARVKGFPREQRPCVAI